MFVSWHSLWLKFSFAIVFQSARFVLGCAKAQEWPVCDVIRSNVDIFYKSASGQNPTDEDREDMQNLLVETIMRQANAGAFKGLGLVQSVDVQSDGGVGGSNGVDLVPIIAGVIAAIILVVCCTVFWFCYRRGSDRDENPKGQNDDTSDEERCTSGDEEEKKERQISVPVAQVVHVEDPGDKTAEGTKKKEGWW